MSDVLWDRAPTVERVRTAIEEHEFLSIFLRGRDWYVLVDLPRTNTQKFSHRLIDHPFGIGDTDFAEALRAIADTLDPKEAAADE